MAIDAIVIPAPPSVGTDIATAIKKVGAPKGRVPTDSIEIGAGENLIVNGTLTINGSLVGAGSGGASRIGELTDVQDISYPDNAILQYDSATQIWVSRANDAFFDGSIDGGLADTIHIDVLDIDGGQAA